MSCRVWHDQDDLPYYELICDDCRVSFTCYDDSCYDWSLLREAACYAGWDTGRGAVTGPHHCPACQQYQPKSTGATTPSTTAGPSAPEHAEETPLIWPPH